MTFKLEKKNFLEDKTYNKTNKYNNLRNKNNYIRRLYNVQNYLF